MKYKKNGKVKISGKWYEISREYEGDDRHGNNTGCYLRGDQFEDLWFPSEVFSEYEPPKAMEWVTEAEHRELFGPTPDSVLMKLNIFLKEKFGNPPPIFR